MKEEVLEKLDDNGHVYRQLVNATSDVIFLLETNGIIVAANDNYAKLLEVSPELLAGTSVYDFVYGNTAAGIRAKSQEVISTGQPVHFESGGKGKVFDTSIYPVFDSKGEVERLSVYVHDITESKQMEAALQLTEEKYRNIYENAREGVFQTSPEGRFLSANLSLARIHGYDTPEELIADVTDISQQLYVEPQSRERLRQLLSANESVQDFEVQMRRKDGSLHWILMNVHAVRDVEGRLKYYEGTMQDVTERKGAEAALVESEERYRTAIEHSNDGVAIIKGDRHLYVNRRFVEMFGYRGPEEIAGQPITMVVHPDDRDLVLGMSSERQRGNVVPSRYEFKGITKEGDVIYIEVSATNISYRGEPAYLVYLRDVTGRKQAEEALRLERNRFHILSEYAPFGVTLIDKDGNYTYVNPKFKEIFGYDLADVPDGRTWFRKAYPDPLYRRQVILDWIMKVKNTHPGEKTPGTAVALCKDGTKKTISYIPVRLSSGEHIVSYEDITERIRAQEALVQSHKELEALNRVKTKAVHHVSHELKTPLAVIQGNVRLLKKKLKDLGFESDIKRFMEVLERNLERLFEVSAETDEIFRVSRELEAAGMLNDLERFSQRVDDFSEMPPEVSAHWQALKAWLNRYLAGSDATFRSVDLYLFALSTVERIKKFTAQRDLEFQIEGEHDLFIFVDPDSLGDIIEGLLKNAVENTPDGGVVKVTLERKDDAVNLHVSDSGVGIDEEDQQYLFDGLFHTRETELYSSKRPYEFGAGGKGLDLLRMKVYGQRFGFTLSVKSNRCVYIPADQDACPGSTDLCPQINSREECLRSGGTTFTISFPTRPA